MKSWVAKPPKLGQPIQHTDQRPIIAQQTFPVKSISKATNSANSKNEGTIS